jgi:hypothetical protein
LTKLKSGPHADGIVGSSQRKATNMISNQMQQLSIQQIVAGQAPGLTTPTTQSSDVHSVQSMTPKGPQQPRGKKKGKGKKGGGGNDKKDGNNVEGEKNKKKKVNFPCNLCKGDHLTHLFPKLEESQCLLMQQQPVILTNPFPQGQNLMQGTSSTPNIDGGNQGTPTPESGTSNVYMLKLDLNLQTRAHDYGNPESAKKDKELPEPSNSLHIEKPMVDPMPHIPKGVLKMDIAQSKC